MRRSRHLAAAFLALAALACAETVPDGIYYKFNEGAGTKRTRRTYDHRLVRLVQDTGDASIATCLGVPRSTVAGRSADSGGT